MSTKKVESEKEFLERMRRISTRPALYAPTRFKSPEVVKSGDRTIIVKNIDGMLYHGHLTPYATHIGQFTDNGLRALRALGLITTADIKRFHVIQKEWRERRNQADDMEQLRKLASRLGYSVVKKTAKAKSTNDKES